MSGFQRSLVVVLLLFTSNAFAWEKVIYISRHGETYANKMHVNIGQRLDPRVVLDEKGLEQARSLAALLEKDGIQQIYVSRLARTHQTAEPLADRFGLVPEIRSALDEMSFGNLEGVAMDSAESKEGFKHVDADCAYRFGRGESRNDMDQRLRPFLKETYRPEAAHTVLLVAHYGVVRELLALMLGLSCGDAAKIHPANSDLFRLSMTDGKVTKLELSKDRKAFREVKVAELE
ncbi:MAG: histidine phosphatase family protein [Pseudomonadota bacterium]